MQLKTILLTITSVVCLIAANPVPAPVADVSPQSVCPGWCGGGTVSENGQLFPAIQQQVKTALFSN